MSPFLRRITARASGKHPRQLRADRNPANPAVAIVLCAILGACATTRYADGLGNFDGGPTVAFESIDGPPAGVFEKLVRSLESEAGLRRLAVVSREGTAQFRVRGYVAANVEKGRATFVWVWDVYATDFTRATRLSGKESGGPAGRDAWGAANDPVIAHIARATMQDLTAFLATSARPPDQPSAPRRGTAVAAIATGGGLAARR